MIAKIIRWLFPPKHDVVSEEYRAERARAIAAEEDLLRERRAEIEARLRTQARIINQRRERSGEGA